MASSKAPIIQCYKADAAILKGSPVKFGTDSEHVAKSAAATDKHIGIAQNTVTAAEDIVEVAMVGGGAKALCGSASVTKGFLLTCGTDFMVKKIANAGDRLIAVAMDDAVSGDLFEVEVIAGQAYATES